MANSKVVFEVVATSKGLKVVAKDINATSKATDNLGKSQDRLNKKSAGFDKQNKSLYQTNLSSAKSFSKMNQTIGGSSGSGALVGSYAVLAANVFAVTAAFNTLRSAAGVEKLQEGLVQFGNQTGQSLELVSKRLQEATDNAVSFEQAMRTAALATSAGFGTEEMEGITKVAKAASLALGRDMGDALDRLTRGAIKLEPEILDELGIMVRLDDATETYAAQLGKTAGALTRFEKQQAFMNAIIQEGSDKFGAIGDNIDANVYDQLAASFADLAREGIDLVNFFLKPFIGFLLEAKGVFLGLVTIFAGSIASRMVPAFGEMGQSAKLAAFASAQAIEQSIQMGTANQIAAQKGIKASKGMPASFIKLEKSIKKGTASTKEMTVAQGQLTRAMNKMVKDSAGGYDTMTRKQKILFNKMKKQKQLILDIKGSEAGPKAQKALGMATARLEAAEDETKIYEEQNVQVFGLRANFEKNIKTFKNIRKSSKKYRDSMVSVGNQTGRANFIAKMYRFTLATLKGGFRTTAISAKVFGKALVGAIPIIGQIIMMVTLAWEAVQFLAKQFGFFSEESKAAKEANKDLDKMLGDIPDKMEEITKMQERATASTQTMVKEYKILGGLAKSVAEEAKRTRIADIAAGTNIQDDDDFSGRSQERQLKRLRQSGPVRSVEQLIKESDKFMETFKAKFGGRGFEQVLLEGTAEGRGGAANVVRQMLGFLDAAEKSFDGLSQAGEAIVRSFAEAEKEINKLFATAAKSTQFDGIDMILTTAVRTLKEMSKQNAEDVMARGIKNAAVFSAALDRGFKDGVGQSLGDIGSGLQSLLGGSLKANMTKMAQIQGLIAKQKEKIALATQEEKPELEAQLKLYQEAHAILKDQAAIAYAQQIPALAEGVKKLRMQIILEKDIQKTLTGRQKAASNLAKNGKIILANKQVEVRKDEVRVRTLEMEDNFFKNIVAETRKKLAITGDINDLSKEEQGILANQARRTEELTTLEEKRAAISFERLEARVADLKIEQQLFNLTKKHETLKNTNRKKESDLRELVADQETGGSSTLSDSFEIAKRTFELATKTAEIQFVIIQAEHALLAARVKIEQGINETEAARLDKIEAGSGASLRSLNDALSATVTASEDSLEAQKGIIEETIRGASLDMSTAILNAFKGMGNVFKQSGGGIALAKGFAGIFQQAATITAQRDRVTKRRTDLESTRDTLDDGVEKDKVIEQIDTLTALENKLTDDIPTAAETASQAFSAMAMSITATLGPEGALAASLASMSATLTGGLDNLEKFAGAMSRMNPEEGEGTKFSAELEGIAAGAQFAADALGSLAQAYNAYSDQKIRAIDKEIAAEKRKDGKSAQSVAKMAAMEKKKEQVARKAFGVTKKLMMAQAIMSTAAAIMMTASTNMGAPWAIPMMVMMGALGAAQVAIISKMQYEGGASVAPPSPQSISVGKRSNKVDVAQSASAGEAAFIRGEKGIGSNANNFTPGGAAGMRRGYATGGEIMVGEQGPEVIKPTAGGYEVIPNDKIGGQNLNANITINAIDAAGVEEVLTAQKGNIIGMIREAAHEHGEEFIEGVNTDAYSGGGG